MRWIGAAIALLAFLGLMAFRYLVTNRVTDQGGMENPDCTHADDLAGG